MRLSASALLFGAISMCAVGAAAQNAPTSGSIGAGAEQRSSHNPSPRPLTIAPTDLSREQCKNFLVKWENLSTENQALPELLAQKAACDNVSR
jgi:hypothetical protein